MKKIVVFIFLLTAFACKNDKEKKEAAPSADYVKERNMFFNNMKDPMEAAAQLEATGAEFNPELMNNPSQFTHYTGNPVKAAANLGIYLADLNYSIAFRQSASTKEYFNAAHELSKATGTEEQTLAYLYVRYNENIERNDSVKAVVTSLLEKSTMELEGTDRERLAGIAMAAYQIENLHLALGTIRSYPKDILPEDSRTVILVPLFKMVLGQRENIETIYGFLKSVTDPTDPDKNPNYMYYTNAFEELIALYRKLDVDEKMAKNEAVALMNDTVMSEIAAKVDAIRGKVISQE